MHLDLRGAQATFWTVALIALLPAPSHGVGNTFEGVPHYAPAVAANDADRVVLVFAAPVDNQYDIFIKQFIVQTDTAPVAAYSSFKLSATSRHESGASVASANGSFLVCWMHEFSVTDNDIHATVYDPYTASSKQSWVIDSGPSDHLGPKLVHAGNHGFLVCYSQPPAFGQPGRIIGRYLDSNHKPKTPFTVKVAPSLTNTLTVTSLSYSPISDRVLVGFASAPDEQVYFGTVRGGATTSLESELHVGTGDRIDTAYNGNTRMFMLASVNDSSPSIPVLSMADTWGQSGQFVPVYRSSFDNAKTRGHVALAPMGQDFVLAFSGNFGGPHPTGVTTMQLSPTTYRKSTYHQALSQAVHMLAGGLCSRPGSRIYLGYCVGDVNSTIYGQNYYPMSIGPHAARRTIDLPPLREQLF